MTAASDDACADNVLFCPDCGYSLHGVEHSERCPECGTPIDRAEASVSRIPWVHRRVIGRIRAYRQTVALATWRVMVLSGEVARPIDTAAARRFATITALLASAPVVAALLVLAWQHGRNLFNPLPDSSMIALSGMIAAEADATVPYAAGVTLWPVPSLASALTLWLVTRAPAIWFTFEGSLPEQRRQRAEALSYYTAAPLVFLPWAGVAYLAGDALRTAGVHATDIRTILRLLAFCVAGLSLLAAWFNLVLLLRRTTHASGLRLIATAAAIPITWCCCAAIGLLAVPWIAGFVWLVVDSLRGD